MAPSAKVGSWLEKNQDVQPSEAYASDSDSGESEASTSAAVREPNGSTANGKQPAVARYEVEDDVEDEDYSPQGDDRGREENIDWEDVLSRLKVAVGDKSKKRRQAFIARYLYVTEDSPPAAQIPALLQSILSVLQTVTDPQQIDEVVAVLVDLVKRDEELAEGSGKMKLGDKLVKWLVLEGEKTVNNTKAATPAGVLPYVHLDLALLQTLSKTRPTFSQSPQFADLLNTLAILLDTVEARENKSYALRTIRYKRRVGIKVWRMARDIRETIPAMLDLLLKSTSWKQAVLIGHIIGVCLRLRPSTKRLFEGQKILSDYKDKILDYYAISIIGSKTALPARASSALTEFNREYVTLDVLSSKLLPTAEKMLLRSPEIALTITTDLLSGLAYDISTLLPGKIVPAALSAAKSSNPETRSKSVGLMRAMSTKCEDLAIQGKIVVEILSLPKSGKTSSPEHRIALLHMAGLFTPNDSTSSIVVDILPGLVAKEGNEPALNALCDALSPHLAYALTANGSIGSAATIAKELGASKVSTRRALSNAVGEAIWTVHTQQGQFSPAGEAFLATVAAAFDTALTAASANQPANSSGFLEGYVPVALALGPLRHSSAVAKLAQNPSLSDLLAVAPKPSFVLNDKVYPRLPTAEDEKWLLRSLEGIISQLDKKLNTDDARLAVGLALIHLSFESKSSEMRRTTAAAVAELAKGHPRSISHVMRDALAVWLQRQDKKFKAKKVDEEEVVESKSREIGKLLSSVFQANNDKSAAEDIAVDFVVLAHHPEIGEDAQVSWIALVQSLNLDPATVAFEKRETILERLWQAASIPPADDRLAEAAYRAITTLAFVQPEIYVTAVLEKLRADLDPATLDFIGLEERGIWATPSDQLFVDVLAPKKDKVENKNRKDYATEKWEEEVREAVAKKKSTQPGAKLSKADHALVTAQMAKEADTRKRISTIQASLRRGTELVRSLVASNSEAVSKHLRTMAESLLNSVFGPGSFLVDERVFAVFLSLAGLAHDRLGEYRRMIAAAILRGHETPFIHDDYLSEGKAELVTRLLHQIDFVSQQTPLDSTTYGLVSMLLSQVTAVGGIGTEPNSDEAQEQLTLAVSIIGSCCGEFSDANYPRLETIRDLLRVITAYPRLAKDAMQALVDLGDAIKDVASVEEVQGLIVGTLSKDMNVRKAALEALQPVDMTELDYSEEIWIAVHDADEQNAKLATHLWEDNGLDLPESYLASLLTYLGHESAAVRTSCAGALAHAIEQYPGQIEATVTGLQDLYADKARLLQPEYDRFGMIIPETVNRADPFEARAAIALALEKLAPLLPDQLVHPVFDFLVTKEALGDRHGQVRRAMLAAGTAIIDLHGSKSVTELMKMFEDHLGQPTPSSETADYIKEAVVILFGRLARHLDSQDERIPKVVERLIEALNTPSELVQSAVADCLPPLVQDMGEEIEYLVDKLFSTLTTGAKYAARRGAAYGLAGVVKGRGLQSLKEYELMDKLVEAAEDKAAYQSRQGALFAFETLSGTLGKVFEPYIISIVPLLLALFGDGNADVREATQDSARVIMSRISGHCVKLMLPTLLGGLEEKQWRTKKGSIELLGAMAFCAPRQLSLSLPTIIPQLTGVINDSHAQVKSAANASLKRFGEVLSNPEIKALQNTLMKALADPTANINKALSALLKTSFEHYLDAPSLALVMPIIDRGLKQRSSEIKRKSVQIVGNMASLTEPRDLTPYLGELMPLLHEVLVDPVPEARATAAKSLGTLVERLGETNFPDLVNQLLGTLRSDTGGIDRQGSAQGLSEVLSALGMERMEGLLPEVIANTASPRAYVREGFISLLVYLPATFGHRFAPHLGRVIPPILNGLADNSEYVREASLNAGKMIISNYSTKAIDLLLPELEKGMLDIHWRIRSASIELTGLLLYRVTGISGKVDLEEGADSPQVADNARKALLDALGQERRDRVLATLYIVRQDTVNVVRSASIHIWKALVQNTPRTTREILPVLMQTIMSLLGSPEVEQQETASRTLGELCRKNGERIFGEIVPILQKAITSTDPRTKEGACLAFADVMVAANKDAVEDHEDAIISAVRTALVDSEASVRSAAARTFDTMQHYLGPKAIDQTIPTLLEAMRDPGETSETALQALQEVMSVRANTVFPVLIPTLTAQPITAFNARALGALVKVAGSALNRRLDSVLGALVKSLEKEQSEEIKEDIQGAIESLLESVEDDEGIHQLEMLLIGWAKDHNPVRRATGCNLFATFCKVNEADTSDYRVDWVRILVSLMDDNVEEVVAAAWEALDTFVKSVEKDELEALVVPLRRAIEGTGSPGRTVPGFSRTKGLQPIVPIVLAGVLNGTQEQKEQATLAIGDLAQRTSEQAIKVYIIQLTGPLIRILTVPVSPQIKSAVLSTLTVLLEEIPQLVKPFHPQLTRTFVKSASDTGGLSIRSRAAAGLEALMKHQPRVDPVVTELMTGIRAADNEIAPSVVLALAAVCKSAGKSIGEAAKASIVELVEEAFMAGRNENYDKAISRVVSGLARHDAESIRSIVETFLAAPTPPTTLVSSMIFAILEDCPDTFYDLDVVQDIVKKVQASVSSDASGISRPAREARDLMKKIDRWENDPEVQDLL